MVDGRVDLGTGDTLGRLVGGHAGGGDAQRLLGEVAGDVDPGDVVPVVVGDAAHVPPAAGHAGEQFGGHPQQRDLGAGVVAVHVRA